MILDLPRVMACDRCGAVGRTIDSRRGGVRPVADDLAERYRESAASVARLDAEASPVP